MQREDHAQLSRDLPSRDTRDLHLHSRDSGPQDMDMRLQDVSVRDLRLLGIVTTSVAR